MDNLAELKEREIKLFEEFLYLNIKNNLLKKMGIPKNEKEIEDREQLIEDVINKNKQFGEKIDELLLLSIN